MDLIIRPRQAGKTTETLRLAAEHFAYIVVPTHEDRERLWRLALQLQLNIPQPITWAEFITGARHRGRGVKAFVIDDVDHCIQMSAGTAPVVGISATGNYTDAGILPVKPEPAPERGILPDLVPARSSCIKCGCPTEYWATMLGKGWVHVGPDRGYLHKDHRPQLTAEA